MRIFGYEIDSETLRSLGEASFEATADEVRRLAEFFQHTAETMERAGDAFGHEHFRDFCRTRGMAKTALEADVIIAAPSAPRPKPTAAALLQNEDEAERFLTRFYGFCDSVIRSISLRYREGRHPELELQIAARDSTTPDQRGWVCVVITMKGVREMMVRETARTTNQVVSHGIHLLRFDDAFGLEFGGAVDATSLADLQRSDAYAVGAKVSFEVRRY